MRPGGYAIVAAYGFGVLMNLWFWAFVTGAEVDYQDGSISYVPGAPMLENLHPRRRVHPAAEVECGAFVRRRADVGWVLTSAGRGPATPSARTSRACTRTERRTRR